MNEQRESHDGDHRDVARRIRRVAAEGELAAHLALEAAGLGAWDIVPATGRSRWSRRARALLGFSPDDEVGSEQFVRSLRPADRARLMEACVRVIEPHGAPSFRIEIPLGGPAARWIALTGAAYVDEQAAVHVVGTIQDVTAEKLDEIRVAELRHEVREPTHATPLALAELCSAMIAEVVLANGDKKIQLHAASSCLGEWDRDRVAQLVRNLVWDAIEHGEAGASLHVALAEDAQFAVLTVASRGTPSGMRQRLGDSLRTDGAKRDGDRLGLHIVQEIAVAHGGSLELLADGDGTVVRVKLAKRQIAQAG